MDLGSLGLKTGAEFRDKICSCVNFLSPILATTAHTCPIVLPWLASSSAVSFRESLSRSSLSVPEANLHIGLLDCSNTHR